LVREKARCDIAQRMIGRRNFGRSVCFALVGWGVCASTLTAGCATTHGPPYNYAAEPDPRKHDYILGASDVLHVTVWHNPDLSADPIVRPDGSITLALVGDIAAAGHTTAQVRAAIAERLKTFVKDDAAIVTVAVSAINSYRFTVSGNVEKQGVYASTRYVTVAEAIALAGGPTRFANPELTVIQRSDGPDKPPRRIPIDYPKILSGQKLEQDLPILAGDVIYVP
jgi:polysaccharide export outer membrane protein